LKNFRMQYEPMKVEALIVRRPKQPVWPCCTTILCGENFQDWSLEILIEDTISIY
jgi:hypothetical protein